MGIKLYRLLEFLNGEKTNFKYRILPYKLIEKLKIWVLVYFIKN